MAPPVEPEPTPPSRLARLWRRLDSWIVRSLGTGVAASVVDHTIGTSLALLGVPTRAAAMTGKFVSGTFSFFTHRTFAFRDHRESVWASGAKFATFVVLIGAAHGQVVVWFRDGLKLPYLVAALLADLLVVTPTWLVLLRFFVFPKAGARGDGSAPPPPPPPG